jgi:uncharacterized metal-binding protein YceD (DUF177 family)
VKILFDKVGSSPKPVALEYQGVRLEGTLEKSGYHRVALDVFLTGHVDLTCDRCGKDYRQNVEQKLALSLSDRMIEDKDDLDIIEFLDGVIDITYIIESEINAIEGSFHYCNECEDSEEELEIEF